MKAKRARKKREGWGRKGNACCKPQTFCPNHVRPRTRSNRAFWLVNSPSINSDDKRDLSIPRRRQRVYVQIICLHFSNLPSSKPNPRPDSRGEINGPDSEFSSRSFTWRCGSGEISIVILVLGDFMHCVFTLGDLMLWSAVRSPNNRLPDSFLGSFHVIVPFIKTSEQWQTPQFSDAIKKFTRVYLPFWRALALYSPCGRLLTRACQNDLIGS